MNYESVIRDFAERTRKNLGIIEGLHAEGGEGYEVTQLVNSMLGLLPTCRRPCLMTCQTNPFWRGDLKKIQRVVLQ